MIMLVYIHVLAVIVVAIPYHITMPHEELKHEFYPQQKPKPEMQGGHVE